MKNKEKGEKEQLLSSINVKIDNKEQKKNRLTLCEQKKRESSLDILNLFILCQKRIKTYNMHETRQRRNRDKTMITHSSENSHVGVSYERKMEKKYVKTKKNTGEVALSTCFATI